jgi:hypothetical protein
MNQLERNIFDKFLPEIAVMPGIGAKKAKELLATFLKESIRESKLDGTYNRPLNYGHILLNQEKSNREAQRLIQIKKSEGVRDEDILWYWNLHEVERRILDKIDIFHRTALYFEYVSKGLSQDDAVKKMFKFRPKWGFESGPSSNNDKPLPPELMDRVNRYVIKRSGTNIDSFRLDCEKFTSFNALIRKEIHAGRL